MRAIAVDWSGARTGAARKIWLAEVAGGRLLRLEAGRSRTELIAHLIEEAQRDPGLVVGLDFAFSFPQWFLYAKDCESAPRVWEQAAREGEEWLRACEAPFWGRPGRRKPDHDGFRRTELNARDQFSAQPKSAFQIGGAGAVGTMSIRGMPFLADLAEAGFNIWPFHPAEPPLVIEIYPRLLTGGLVKSDPRARERHLEGSYPEMDAPLRQMAAGSEDALDAAVSAVVMARHMILALPPARDEVERLEGRIWYPTHVREPGSAPVEASEAASDCPFCAGRTPLPFRSDHAVAIRDGYPVSEGHTLVIPTRHVTSLFDLSAVEQEEVWRLVAEVRADLARSHGPDGFNIGVNDGDAAGQTVRHAHVHVIPRYSGDVPDPRGGIRWVVPEKAPYWSDEG